MLNAGVRSRLLIGLLIAALVLLAAVPASADGEFGPVEMVRASGVNIAVPGYSVPSYVDWNNDGKCDLVVGEGSGMFTPKVRVYLNSGTAAAPAFAGYSYAQSLGSDLTATGSGCMGLFPRVCYWDGDGMKDLIVGQSDGTVKFFKNTGTDVGPSFDGGTLLQVGAPGAKSNIGVGARACPATIDWNNDGRKDLVVGAKDTYGKIHLFINSGTDTSPDFLAETLVSEGSGDLSVPTDRSSPTVLDYDGDGKKDVITGNTNGQLLLYKNVGSDSGPHFSGYSYMESDGVDIDLIASRSRPFGCDWTGDGLTDVLIGASDGQVYLYQGIPEPATIGIIAVGWVVLRHRRRK